MSQPLTYNGKAVVYHADVDCDDDHHWFYHYLLDAQSLQYAACIPWSGSEPMSTAQVQQWLEAGAPQRVWSGPLRHLFPLTDARLANFTTSRNAN